MVCSNCGYALGPDDQYCGGCGAFLTDSPEDDTAPQEEPWGIPYAPAPVPEQQPDRRTPPAGMIAAAVAGVVLIAFLLFWVLRPDGEDAVAGDTSTTGPTATAPAQTDGATGTETTSGTDTATASPTTSPTDQPTPTQIDLPGAAEQCGNIGNLVVYRGNSTTSCPFAENVARAFDALEDPVTDEATLTGVSSPVTGLDYDLTCEFTAPVRCTGGNDAVVYLVTAS